LSCFNQSGQLLGGEYPLVSLAINEKCRRGLHTALFTFGLLLIHLGRVLATVQTGIEGAGIEAELHGEFLQVVRRECTAVFATLMSEQVIGVCPEFVLIPGAFGGLGGPFRVRADDGKVAIDQSATDAAATSSSISMIPT
jgi:hypothetical protein